MAAEAKKTRAPSSISFPYRDLDTAISVAQAMHNAGGVALSTDQLAGVLDLQPGSGNFAMKVAAARIFGLTINADGKHKLTTVGFSIVDKDEIRQRTARAHAFLHVPLFRKVYSEFRGQQLPPKLGLENAMIGFGVSPKQGETARLVLEKSAKQAGFFSAGEDRLIEPILPKSYGVPGEAQVDATAAPVEPATAKETTNPKTAGLPFFVQGLLESLPPQGQDWAIERRVKWLQAAAHCFDLMYQGAGEIQIIGKAAPEPTPTRAPAAPAAPVAPRPAVMKSMDEGGGMSAGGRPTARASKPELDDDIPF